MVDTVGRKFWEEEFTGEENFTVGEFSAVNMKNWGCPNVKKHREIKDSDEYITLDISLKFGSPDKMRITYSEPKYNLWRTGNLSITSLGRKAKVSQKKYKKEIYAIVNLSMKYLSKIISEFENHLIKVMRGVGPNINLLTVTCNYQDILWNLWWELMPSTCTVTL